jgi:hypothetical protein
MVAMSTLADGTQKHVSASKAGRSFRWQSNEGCVPVVEVSGGMYSLCDWFMYVLDVQYVSSKSYVQPITNYQIGTTEAELARSSSGWQRVESRSCLLYNSQVGNGLQSSEW